MCHRFISWKRRVSLVLAGSVTMLALADGCWDSAIAVRFREAYAPGFTEGLTSAITNPADAEAGLRQAGAALLDGLGAIIQPRSSSSTNSHRSG